MSMTTNDRVQTYLNLTAYLLYRSLAPFGSGAEDTTSAAAPDAERAYIRQARAAQWLADAAVMCPDHPVYLDAAFEVLSASHHTRLPVTSDDLDRAHIYVDMVITQHRAGLCAADAA